MTGIVDVGGGLRGAYTAGIYDYLLDQKVSFKYCIGVSAGSANLISFLAGQRDRSLRFYNDYAMRREYMSMGNFISKGSYLDVDYIYTTLSNADGEDPVDYDAFAANESEYKVVTTNANTGLPHYFTKEDVHRNDYSIIKASCCLPGVCKPYLVNGVPYFDGGISDPVPYKKALADGCDRLIVLLTRPSDFVRKPQNHMLALKVMLRKYPAALHSLTQRYLRYNRSVAECKQLEKEGRVLLLAPSDISGMSTLTKDAAAINRLYHMGYDDGLKIIHFLDPHAA